MRLEEENINQNKTLLWVILSNSLRKFCAQLEEKQFFKKIGKSNLPDLYLYNSVGFVVCFSVIMLQVKVLFVLFLLYLFFPFTTFAISLSTQAFILPYLLWTYFKK